MVTKIYSIEGNIGSGKSTFIKILKEFLHNDPNYFFLEEPVSIWETIKDKSGDTILSKFYADQKKYSFAFQMMAYISRISMLKKAIEENEGKIIICERSVLTDKNVFAQMLYDSGNIEDVEIQIYKMWFNEFIKDTPIAGIIYIKASPDTAYKRVQIRKREGENIPLEYLEKCHSYHEKWLTKWGNILTFDADHHKELEINDYKKWITDVITFIESN